MRLLLILTLPPDVIDDYRRRLSALFPNLVIETANSKAASEAALPRANILLSFGQVMKNFSIDLARAPQLKFVQALGTGMDGILDQPALRPETVVASLNGVHGAPVSEAALAGMLALSRDVPRAVRSQDRREWVRWPARLLDGKTVGILGVGVIAAALAPKCKALGMTVVGLSSQPRDLPGFDAMRPMDEMMDVLPTLDHLVLLTPYSRRTHHLMNADAFAAMKKGAYLINVARGGVVDEAALIAALQSGHLGGAALDVFETEPLPADSPLWDFPNVIITTHQGGFCDTYIDLVMPVLERNLRSFLSGDIAAMTNLERRGA